VTVRNCTSQFAVSLVHRLSSPSMRRYLYVIKGWPVVAYDHDKADHDHRGTLVGVYEDDREMARRLGELMAAAVVRARAN
jgi:hypothetical protein